MGKLDGKIVICPVHGMKFDVTTGCFAGSSDFGVASYPVEVVDGKIMVAVS
jgi:3-phenylpropionate/trans-cinnamate dioxygenase ferredoxin component